MAAAWKMDGSTNGEETSKFPHIFECTRCNRSGTEPSKQSFVCGAAFGLWFPNGFDSPTWLIEERELYPAHRTAQIRSAIAQDSSERHSAARAEGVVLTADERETVLMLIKAYLYGDVDETLNTYHAAKTLRAKLER